MNPKPSCVISLIVLMLSASISFAQTLSPEGKSAISDYLQEVTESTHIPGMVALVVNRDGILFHEAFGDRDVGNELPMTTDTLFRIASMTKPVTSLAVMMLVEEGAVDLDDPVEMYLPDLADREVFTDFDARTGEYSARPANGSITVRQLLTHTSGLGYSFDSVELLTLMGNDFSASATAFPLLHNPGEAWTYGESTRVLGNLVEVVSGQPLFEFMSARILSPLQMQDTFYDVPSEKNNRLVTIHQSNGTELIEVPNPAVTTSPHNGDGGLTSTAEDYSRFIRLFLNGGVLEDSGRLLSERAISLMGQSHTGEVKVREMQTALPLVSQNFPLGAGVDTFGLGFQRTESSQAYSRSVGSLAWAGIFNTEFWIDPEAGIGAVLMMQYLPFYDETAIENLVEFESLVYRNLQAIPSN